VIWLMERSCSIIHAKLRRREIGEWLVSHTVQPGDAEPTLNVITNYVKAALRDE